MPTGTAVTETDALGLLADLTGDPAATFRPGQWEAVEAVAGRRDRVLLVQRTGWGKSAVYFIATALLRRAGAGPSLLVSPLLALMRDQIRAAERMGVRAVTINSENREDWDEVVDRLRAGDADLLLVAPERLANEEFRSEVLPKIAVQSGLLIVDEAHCISDWGHDFRPDYRRIVRVLDHLPPGVPVLCCTATANDRVVEDVEAQLVGLSTIRGPLGRDGLALHVIDLADQAERMAWLAHWLPRLDGTGIVYCLTVADTERVASYLQAHGISAEAYHGGIDPVAKPVLEQRLLANELKVLVATTALGMGFDKPDLAFVVHFQAPGSPVAYYQQVGRAGRALERSVGVLLRGREDEDIQDFFITRSFPPQEEAETVVRLLEFAEEPVKVQELEAEVNVARGRLVHMLKLLEIEGAVMKERGRYLRTARPWDYDLRRVEDVTATRRREQDEMRAFAATAGCRMALLRGLLDDPEAQACGRCDNCTGERMTTTDVTQTRAAVEHLRRASLAIEPRKMWPGGGGNPTGRIAVDERFVSGQAVCRWGDAGWGRTVVAGRAGGRFDDDVVAAAADLVRTRWRPDPAPAWVVPVPSLRRPDLVPDLAQRVAGLLGLPVHQVLGKQRECAPQNEMANSAQQVANLRGAFAAVRKAPATPCLLVDDIVESRWTLTVCAALLAKAGAGPVQVLALADAGAGG